MINSVFNNNKVVLKMPKYVLNEEKKGIEIYFEEIPAAEVREELKSNGFRWSRFGGFWYAKQKPETLIFAENLAKKESGESAENKSFELTKENLISCLNIEAWKAGKSSSVATISRGVKKFLKKAGIECECRSKQFSMGDSVTITTKDLKYSTEKILEKLFSIFSAGYFDGMEDIYNYYDKKDGIPTTKYFFYNNEISTDLRQQIKDILIDKGFGESFFGNWNDEQRTILKSFHNEFDDRLNLPVFGN